MWVLDHLEDIDSDMSAFHRVDDARVTLPASLYFERAERLAFYPGVMQIRVREAIERGEVGPVASAPVPSDDDWFGHDTGGAA